MFLRRPANQRRSKKMTSPKSAFTINPTPAKLALEKPTRSIEEEEEYQISNLSVCLRYLKIH
jgi:hypothetical protein